MRRVVRSHLLLEVLPQALDHLAGGAAASVRVGALDVAPNVLRRVRLEELLVRIAEVHVRNDDVLADLPRQQGNYRTSICSIFVDEGGGGGVDTRLRVS